ncbi:MAG: hypothetical protein ACFE0I_15930 [Elainellaceae cyanobacterium]
MKARPGAPGHDPQHRSPDVAGDMPQGFVGLLGGNGDGGSDDAATAEDKGSNGPVRDAYESRR